MKNASTIILAAAVLLCLCAGANAQTATLTYPDGAKYTGQVADGKANGYGVKIWPNGEKYIGQVNDDGKPHGEGALYDADGKVIQQGSFKDGEYAGQ